MPKRRLRSPTRQDIVLKPVRPNAAVEAKFRRKLQRMIDEMAASYAYWTSAQWRAKPPELAQDSERADEPGSPAMGLRAEMDRLGARWLKRFEEAAPELARWFSTSMAERSTETLRKILRDGGFSVKFQMSREVNDVLQANIGEQIQLIKSIPQQFHTQVQGIVMRGVSEGRDLHAISQGLQHELGVTQRRANFIAIDQANKANATITRARQQELGITEAIWQHSGGGRHPRPDHVAASKAKLRYDVNKGALISGEYIYPGQLPRCRCVSKPVIPGFD